MLDMNKLADPQYLFKLQQALAEADKEYRYMKAQLRKTQRDNFGDHTRPKAEVPNLDIHQEEKHHQAYVDDAIKTKKTHYIEDMRTKNKLLNMIAQAEGTSDKVLSTLKASQLAKLGGASSGYDLTLGYGAYHEPLDKPLTQMTIGEVMTLQKAMLKNPQNKLNSSAVGRYQILTSNFPTLMKKTGLTKTDLFSPKNQDKMAMGLIGDDALNYRMGTISTNTFKRKLAHIWDSLPWEGTAGWAGNTRHSSGIDEDVFTEGLEEFKLSNF